MSNEKDYRKLKKSLKELEYTIAFLKAKVDHLLDYKKICELLTPLPKHKIRYLSSYCGGPAPEDLKQKGYEIVGGIDGCNSELWVKKKDVEDDEDEDEDEDEDDE